MLDKLRAALLAAMLALVTPAPAKLTCDIPPDMSDNWMRCLEQFMQEQARKRKEDARRQPAPVPIPPPRPPIPQQAPREWRI